ncbi:hypothetical protein [Vibrio brasiliensis]|uniref:hypothetical protein n=1 Tax=Vibrio brasiliensis TaxID=170652 RepID=UPI001EFCDA08|nr:hypothetical protein [Vibrio brasiliensis]MCG9727646.1 hypothetical protein [Vibrio brasiliensis]
MFNEIKQFEDKLESLSGSSGAFIRSAMYHVNMAEKLIGIDYEMSAFRLITAEEEAATSIIMMLKEHLYEGASKLKKNDHIHKQCLYPYIASIAHLMEKDLDQISGYPPVLEWVTEHGKPAISLGFRIDVGGKKITMQSTPPLNFKRSNESGDFDFSKQLLDFLLEKGFDDAVKHLKDTTNQRNRLLYSDGSQIPNSLAETSNGKFERFAKYQLQKINVLIVIYFMTAPYKRHERARFLEQTLKGYVKVLDHVKGKRL